MEKYKSFTPRELYDMHKARIEKLFTSGFGWNKSLSIAAAGVALSRGKEAYLFNFEGEVYHTLNFDSCDAIEQVVD